MQTKLAFFLSILVAFTCAAAIKPSASTARVMQANTKFAFKLLQQIRQNSSATNIFFSPASISWCMGMALNGAGGPTRDEISSALETKGIPLTELNHGYADWEKSWSNIDPKVELHVANSIWARKGVSLKPDFIGANQDYLGAEVSVLDFNDPRSIGTINGWVSNKTRNKIDKIVDEISSDSVLFLINAIYFNGKWTRAFDAAQTKQGPFTTLSGATRDVAMMHRRGTFEYFENENFQAIRLPYGNKRLNMDIFLPSSKVSGSNFLNMVQSQNWTDWMSQFSESDGTIALPRFRVEYEINLNASLKALGMRAAFDPNRADFSNMTQNTQPTYISQVKHKAFAEVNEEGTEAAAVTSTEIRAVSMPVTKPFTMIVNRPFFFAIEDAATQTVLFVGWIVSPT